MDDETLMDNIVEKEGVDEGELGGNVGSTAFAPDVVTVTVFVAPGGEDAGRIVGGGL